MSIESDWWYQWLILDLIVCGSTFTASSLVQARDDNRSNLNWIQVDPNPLLKGGSRFEFKSACLICQDLDGAI